MAVPNYQYEPLTPPSSWTADEKRLLQRITDIFDDIYMKWGRLDSNHLAPSAVKEKNIAPNAVTDSKILNVDAAKVGRLDVVSFEAVRARIQDLAADLITTNSFTAKWAEIESAVIDHLRVKYSDTDEGLFRNLTGGKVAIDRLSVQQLQVVDAVVGQLTMVDMEGNLYRISIDADGGLVATPTGETNPDFEDGALPEGWRSVASNLTVGEIDAGRIVAQSATFFDVIASTIVVSVLTADEAFLSRIVTGVIESPTIQDMADGIEGLAQIILTPEQIKQTVFQSSEYDSLSNSVTLNANELALVKTEKTELEGRVDTIEQSVVIDGSTMTLGRSDVPVTTSISESGFEVAERGGDVLSYARQGKMGAQRLLLEDALLVGNMALKDAGDGHVIAFRYGG